MRNSKDTSSFSDKNVTHTQNLPPKTKSNNASNDATDEYKYIPGADHPKSEASESK